MTEEEKKLLKIFKAQVEKEETEYFSVNAYTQLLYDSHKTVLNLIEKLQEENEVLKRAYDKQTGEIGDYLLELQKKDLMIDLMAEYMFNKNKAQLIIEYGIENKEQLIKEFEKLAKEGGE